MYPGNILSIHSGRKERARIKNGTRSRYPRGALLRRVIKDYPTVGDMCLSHGSEPIFPGTSELIYFLSKTQAIRLRKNLDT